MTQFKKKIEILSNELKQDCLTERPDPGIFQTRAFTRIFTKSSSLERLFRQGVMSK